MSGTIIKVFVAYTGGAEAEAGIAFEAVQKANTALRDHGMILEPYQWKQERPRRGRAQSLINMRVDECDVFVGIVGTGWGTPPPGTQYSSGFEEEYRRVAERGERGGSVETMMMLQEVPESMARDPGPNLERNLAFRERIKTEVLYGTFSTHDQLRIELLLCLVQVALRLRARGSLDVHQATDAVAAGFGRVATEDQTRELVAAGTPKPEPTSGVDDIAMEDQIGELFPITRPEPGSTSGTDYIAVEDRIRALVVAGTPEPESTEEQAIVSALSDVATTRFFCKYAADPAWLDWLDQRKALGSLFDPRCQLTDAQQLLSTWITRRFIVEHWPQVMALIGAHDGVVNHEFWRGIVLELSHRKDRPPSDVLAMWVAVLLKDAPPVIGELQHLDYLLSICKWPEDGHASLPLLSYLLTPLPVLDTALLRLQTETGEPKFGFRLDLRGTEYWLREAWSRLSPHVGEFWRVLLPTAEKHLTDAHQWSVTFGRGTDDNDSESTWRAAIEEHEQDRDSRRAFDTLVDVARDILVHLLTTDEFITTGQHLVDLWFGSQVPLLRRIAVYGVGIANARTSDEKIAWLLDRDLLYRHGFKHETFQVIKAALGTCQEDTIRRLVDRATTTTGEGIGSESEIREYEKFNLLTWMGQCALGSVVVEEALNKVQQANPHFKPREYPDLDMWMSGLQFIEPKSLVTAEELLQKPISEAAEFLVATGVDSAEGWDDNRRGLLQMMSGVVAANFSWSQRLAEELGTHEQWAGDVWDNLIRGWTRETLSEPQWDAVVEILSSFRTVHRHTDGGCELIEKKVREESDVSPHLLAKLESLSDVIWGELKSLNAEERSSDDWLTTAVNHGAGKLAEFWLQALHRRFQTTTEPWTGLPLDYKRRFDEVVSGESYGAQLARCVLVSRIHYLYSRDRNWTRESLVPLMDFDSDLLRATQVWHGFLMWGRVHVGLVADLKPLCLKAITHIDTGRRGYRELLFGSITSILLGDMDDQPDLPWLKRAIANPATTDDDRQEIARGIRMALRHEDHDSKKSMWKRWLKEFWTDRSNSVQIPLSAREAGHLIEWTRWLEPVFGEAVDCACQTSTFNNDYTLFFNELNESGLPESHANDVMRLMVHILRHAETTWWIGDDLISLHRRLSEQIKESDLFPLTNELKRLGVL